MITIYKSWTQNNIFNIRKIIKKMEIEEDKALKKVKVTKKANW